MRRVALLLVGVLLLLALTACSPLQPIIDKIETYRTAMWMDFIDWMYSSMVEAICYTAPQIINNPQVQGLHKQFTNLATYLIFILTAYNGMSAMLGWKHTSYGNILARMLVALVLNSLIISILAWVINIDNQLVRGIIAFGSGHLDLNAANFAIMGYSDQLIEGLAQILFVMAFLYYMVKILFMYATRLFDLMLLTISAPFAFVASIFDSGQKVFQRWLKELIAVLMIQLVHAFYITVFTVIMFGPFSPLDGAASSFTRVLLVIGALWRMSSVPGWIRGLIVYSEDVNSMLAQAKASTGAGAVQKAASRIGKIITKRR